MCTATAKKILAVTAARNIRCLIFDKDERLRLPLEKVLRDLGLEVFGTDDAEAAYTLHCQQPFDLLLLQWNNHPPSSQKIMREIHTCCKHLPKVVVMVSQGRASLVFPFPVSGIIFKPFGADKLIKAVCESIGE